MSGSDPFSMAAGSFPQTGLPSTDPNQGMLGVAPSTWQTIGRFGSGMIAGANARTADGHLANGTGFAGGFGAGVNSALDDQQHQAMLRSSLGQRAEETQGLHLQNQMNLMQMPVAQQRALLQQAYMHQMMQGGMGGGMPSGDAGGSVWGGGGSAPPPGADASAAPAGGAGGYAGTVNGPLEGGAGQNPNSTASGYGQLIDSQKIAFANANPQYFQGATGWDDVKGRFADPQVGTAATNWMAAQNAPVLAKYGVQASGPNLAMAHRLGPVAGAAVAQAPDNLPISQVLAQSIGPEKAQQYVQANPSWGNQSVGEFRSGFANVPDYGPATAQGGSYIGQADSLMRQAAVLEQRQAAAKFVGLPPPPGDPAMMRQAAQQFRQQGLELQAAGPKATATGQAQGQADLQYKPQIAAKEAAAKAQVDLATAGPIQAQKSANMNLDVRPGGMVRTIGPNGEERWVKNPQLEKVQNPDGTETYQHISPAVPGSPEGTLGTSEPVLGPDGRPAVAKLPPNVQLARNKAYEDFQGKDTDSYIAAQNTHGWLEQMNHAADSLNQDGGFLATGPTAPSRLHFAAVVNDIARTTGLGNLFDPNKIANWEELKKATTTAGFELSSHYEGHARQAAQTIMNATSAVPSESNSPIGFHLVSAGIQEAAQSAIDLHEFKQEAYNKGGDLTKSEVQFFQAHPEQMYARRAISTVHPYPVKTAADFNRYLPGTYVTYPNGAVKQVPEREGMPAIPEYLRSAPPAQSAAAPPSTPVQSPAAAPAGYTGVPVKGVDLPGGKFGIQFGSPGSQ